MNEQVNVAVNITGNGAQVEKNVKSIRQELREAQQNAVNLAREFGELSPQALDAAKRVANLKDEFGDLQQRIQALNPDAKFKAFSQSLQGVAGGFAGLQGAIGLFGTESAELEKQLLKVQSALALSQGIDSVLEARDSFKTLGALIKTNVVSAFSTLKGAITATGIGALVVGVGLLITNFDKVKQVVLKFVPGLAQVGEFIGKLVTQITDFVGITNAAERAIDALASKNKIRNEDIARQIKLLQAQGGQEEKIAELQKQSARNELEVLRKKAGEKKVLYGEDAKNYKDLQNQIAVIDAEERRRQAEEAKTRQKESEQRAKEAEAKRKEQEQKDLDRFINESKRRTEQANYEREQELEIIAELTAIDEQAKADADERQRIAAEIDLEYAKNNYEAKKKLDELELKRRQENAIAYIGILTNLGNILGQQTAAGKALGIATALINTYQGATEALKEKSTLPQPFSTIARFAAAGAIIANGLRTVKQIASVKVPGGGGGSAGVGGGTAAPDRGGLMGATSAVAAPIAPGVQVTNTQTIGTTDVNVQNQTAVKAFVVERDITDSQDRIAKIKAAATI